MGRTMPTECEHGNVIDWGDFGPEDGPLPECPECEDRSALVLTEGEWRDLAAIAAYYKLTTDYALDMAAAPLIRSTVTRRHTLCDRIIDAQADPS
jgi:hypothetical protein